MANRRDTEFKPEDYPTEDAAITGNECDPLPNKGKDSEKESGKAEVEEDEEEARRKEAQELLALVEENEELERNGTTALVDEHGDQLLVDDGYRNPCGFTCFGFQKD